MKDVKDTARISLADRWRGKALVGLAAIISLLLGVLVSAPSPAGAATGAEITDAGCSANTLPANDDGSTSFVDLPHALDFYGSTYAGLYVNNNGNVTFQASLGTYTPFTIGADTPPIIAPFLADVDTRGAGSSQVTYGTTTYGGQDAFCINWNNVGYYNQHTDKLNSFQLLLVSRDDVGSGDFDIIMNYGAITWETGDASGGSNGFGGTSAGAGYSAGDNDASHFFQFPGSLENGALLDSNTDTGLTNHSSGSAQVGRYVFPVRNGAGAGAASFSGTVSGPGNAPQANAPVQACPTTGGGQCFLGYTSSTGSYSIIGVAPGTYNLTANPPAGSNLTPGRAGPITVNNGSAINQDLALTGPTPPPNGTSITGPTNVPSDGNIPVVNWQDNLSLDTQACTAAQLTYTITVAGTVIRSGPMQEVSTEHYHATVAAVYPNHGDAVVNISGTCPAGQQIDTTFNIYIDPSGTVVDTHNNPVTGATVTLLRSDTSSGPFTVVPNGDSIMSPANRTNPTTTGSNGAFGWDVISGYYELQASKAGCHVPNSADTTLTSDVYEVPPAALGITLTLDCPSTPAGGQPQLDRTAVGYRTAAGSSLTTNTVTTTGPGELLVALVQADGPANAQQSVTSVTGAGLTWTRAGNVSISGAGTTAIWQAYATAKVTNASVSAGLSRAASGSITVESFTGAAPTLGAVGVGSQPTGPNARATLTPRSSNSLVIGSGIDATSATRPVPAAGQSLVTYFADRGATNWYWTQKVAVATVAGTPVSVLDAVPSGDRWSVVAAEVRPAA